MWLYVWTRVVQHKELTVSTLYTIIGNRYFVVHFDVYLSSCEENCYMTLLGFDEFLKVNFHYFKVCQDHLYTRKLQFDEPTGRMKSDKNKKT